MFIQTWNKYLPVIRIFLKRSVNGEQTLDMNKSDFQRAAGGRKIKFTFSTTVVRGRLNGSENPPALAKDLVTVLQQDNVSNKFIRENQLEFIMNANCQLLIKNITPPEEAAIKIEEENNVVEEVNPGNTNT